MWACPMASKSALCPEAGPFWLPCALPRYFATGPCRTHNPQSGETASQCASILFFGLSFGVSCPQRLLLEPLIHNDCSWRKTHALSHACTHSRIHAHTQACTHTLTHACTHSRTLSHMHAHNHAHTHAHTHKCTHIIMHAWTHSQMHAHTHACTHPHSRMHAHNHACMHARKHTEANCM